MPSTLDYKRRIDDRPKDSHITVDLSDKKSHDQLDDEFWKGIRESKASEVKEEFSEDAYLSLINDSYEVPMEFHGRFYNSAEEWKDHDPIAFREDYLNWIDGNEKDGIDTGHDDYHNQSSSDDQFKGQSTEDFDSYNLGNPKDDLEKPTSADQRIADTQESGQVDTDPHWKSGRFRRGGSWADKKEEWQKSQGEAKEVIDDTEKDEIFQYLFELQSSGKTNMFGSIPWVQGEFPHLDVKEVKAVVMEWMQNYQEIHDRMGIDFI